MGPDRWSHDRPLLAPYCRWLRGARGVRTRRLPREPVFIRCGTPRVTARGFATHLLEQKTDIHVIQSLPPRKRGFCLARAAAMAGALEVGNDSLATSPRCSTRYSTRRPGCLEAATLTRATAKNVASRGFPFVELLSDICGIGGAARSTHAHH